MLLWQHERACRKALEFAGLESPGVCARALAASAAGLDDIGYILARGSELDAKAAEKLEALTRRRAAGEPLAYVLGLREFYGLPFSASPAALIPRPETELLVELALRFMPRDRIAFADLGSGSGCIGLALMRERPQWRGILLDNSGVALALAKVNAASLGCAPGIMAGDIFALPFAGGILDLIVSNPPYIGEQEIGEVCAETLAWEPHCALFSAKGGLAHAEAVIAGAMRVLKPGGCLILEHGAGQAAAIRGLLEAAGFADVLGFNDLAGLPRAAVARKT